MKILPQGESSTLIYEDDEQKALNLATALRQTNKFIDVVQSYKSIAVYHNPNEQVVGLIQSVVTDNIKIDSKKHTIPVCYDRSLDFERIAQFSKLPKDEVIEIHTSIEFKVYAIGFCPGFPFLGYLPEKLNIPRLESPRMKLPAGSVGITGNQTGIYTMERPGGWNIIGQTPIELVNVQDEYFPIKVGDTVKFVSISLREFFFLRFKRKRRLTTSCFFL